MPFAKEFYNEKMNAYMKQGRQDDPEKYRERERRYLQRLKQEAFTKLGNKCSNCKCDVIEILEVNHINGGGRKDRQKCGQKGLYRKIIKGSNEYNLLCRVCNSLHYVADLLNHTGHKVIWKRSRIIAPKL